MEGPEVADAYRDKYVAFVDLLGFGDLVRAADQDARKRTEILNVLDLFQETLSPNPYIEMRLTQFSDSIIISAARTPAGLVEMFASLNALTSNLLQHDIFIRGGLTAGGIHHDARFVFGLGVNEAYDMERKACHPMIHISPSVVADVENGAPYLRPWIEYDGKNKDRAFFHHLLPYVVYDPNNPRPGMVVLDQPAVRIIDLLCHRLNCHTDRALAKAEWFQEYWNRTVATRGIFGRIERGVRERVSTFGPTIVVRRVNEG